MFIYVCVQVCGALRGVCVFICMCPYAFMDMHVQCMCVSCVYFLNNRCHVSLWEADASDYITRGHIHTSQHRPGIRNSF